MIKHKAEVVCQECKYHSNKPSKCGLYKNKYVGRKQEACKRYAKR